MATTLTNPAPFTIVPITYDVQRELITQIADEYMPLTVSGIDDKAGLEAVHKARMEVKNLRVRIEKRRKQLKAESLEYGRQVDSAAKELTDLLTPIETHLENEEAIVAREKARLEREAEGKRQAMIRERFNCLSECSFPGGNSYLEGDIARFTVAEFSAVLDSERVAKAAFDERMAAEKAERERIAEQQRIEAERLAKERAELERQRREQVEAQAKIDAEQKRLLEAELEQKRLAFLEKAKAEAAEKARLEAIAEQERKAAEAKAKAEADERERQRIEALRPDCEKLITIADRVRDIDVPVLSKAAAPAACEVIKLLESCEASIREVANGLTK